MKKTILSAAVILLLLLSICPAAFADVTYPDPAPLEVGQTLNHLAASVEPGSSVTVSAGSLPPGVDLSLDEQADALYVYLRGTPTLAGHYDAVLNVNDESSFLCSVDVEPAMPKLIVGPSVSCFLNDIVHVTVTASVSDGGELSYQWYASDGSSQSSLIAGAVEPVYQPGTDYVGTTYYYCIVTNRNNDLEVSVVSPSIAVTVDAVRISAVSVETLPTRTDYTVGDELDTAGLQLHVDFTDGSSQIIDSGFQVYPTLLEHAGEQTIELSYQEQHCSFTVTVAEPQEILQSIEILTLPNRTAYVVGEQLDPSGLTVRVNSNLGSYEISEGLNCSPSLLQQEGSQVITVSYQDLECTFSVTVESEEVPSYLSLYQLPNRLSYTVGDTLDTTGLVLYLVSNKNNVTQVAEGYSITPTRLDREGQQEITVSYGGFTCSFNVNVSAAGLAPSPSPSPYPTPGAAPSASPVPTAAPTASVPLPTTAPAAAATPEPTSFPMPTRTPQPSRTVGSSKSFVGVIAVASVLALVILGAYVFIMNRGGFDVLEEKLENLLRRNNRRK